LSYLVAQQARYLETAGAREFVLASKKFVRLLYQLSAEVEIPFGYQHICANAGRFGRSRQPRRPSADYENVRLQFFHDQATSFGKRFIVPRPFWVSTFIPRFSGVTHVRTFGTPSTTIKHELHFPIAQKKPLGRFISGVYR
jgi:hypothetical protein